LTAEGNIDSIVWNEFFPNQRSGVMIEIGAARPDFLSIGAGFRSKGWRVISIEPNPDFAHKHRELGHEIYEYACSDVDADGVDFVVAEGGSNLPDYHGGTVTAESFSSLGVRGKYKEMLTNMSNQFALRTIKVGVRRLDTILAGLQGIEKIDVLAADVEGWELECLAGFSFGPLAPKVAIIENLFQDTGYRDFMRQRGYKLWRFSEPNDVYVLGPRS
jgi:FkbM family methyltransferase